jgi:ribonuclease E
VYADQAATDPKSVLVYVKKPGEELPEHEPEATTNGTIEQLKASKKLKTRGRKPKVKVESELEAVEESEVFTEPETIVQLSPSELEVIAELATVELSPSEPEAIEELETETETETEAEAEDKNVRRRRRRRSSAT